MDGSFINFSTQQASAIDAVAHWLKHDSRQKQVFRLFGYAGTGKTTLARYFADGLNGPVVYAAYTGKAALNMAKKGCKGATTIHSLIYETRRVEDGTFEMTLREDGPITDAAAIILDEISMINAEIAADLLSFGKPVLVLGDPAQLPPIKGAGFFTEARPDVMLEEIHRQAHDSPIIRLATQVREGKVLQLGAYGQSAVVLGSSIDEAALAGADQILVGLNATRNAYNSVLRAIHKHWGVLPEPGEKLVCLRNDHPLGIFNGGLFRVIQEPVVDEKRNLVRLQVTNDDFPEQKAIEVKVRRECFTGEFDALDWRDKRGTQEFAFGNALTVHKAQGSQWPDVLVFDESASFRENRHRWLYTAITRASERVTVAVGR